MPEQTIKELIMTQINEFKEKNQNKYTDSKMAQMFAQDNLISGLCLLQCLKTESIQQNQLNKEQSRAVLKAARTVMSFHKLEQEQNSNERLADLLKVPKVPKPADKMNDEDRSRIKREQKR